MGFFSLSQKECSICAFLALNSFVLFILFVLSFLLQKESKGFIFFEVEMFRSVVLEVWECFFLAECTVQFIMSWLFYIPT